ncbi:MAG: hypothetical protein PHU62_01935 [Bacteroidales bacterium]|jgi:hypothetical protein|nr:hypothetical protein [Bacteroidales bacterium]MDD2203766.1 hypothetical protein [Bacteroidales bacterium]MDD3151600.1 hypothetical protein [Bacteroidales bacterium]MDD3913295.1 hypothetical protein [Bacteroidales bacterium]MDD4633326.1 hypothetical protein [Bacteroidales bacterium]
MKISQAHHNILLILSLAAIILTSCIADPTDRDKFIGDYEGSYASYARMDVGMHYYEDTISGNETFSIVYGDKDDEVIIIMENLQVVGSVRGKKINFEKYTITTEEDGQIANTTYNMTAKMSDNIFTYTTNFYGTVLYEQSIFQITGVLTGKAVKK